MSARTHVTIGTREIGPGRPIQHDNAALRDGILRITDQDFVQGIRLALAKHEDGRGCDHVEQPLREDRQREKRLEFAND